MKRLLIHVIMLQLVTFVFAEVPPNIDDSWEEAHLSSMTGSVYLDAHILPTGDASFFLYSNGDLVELRRGEVTESTWSIVEENVSGLPDRFFKIRLDRITYLAEVWNENVLVLMSIDSERFHSLHILRRSE